MSLPNYLAKIKSAGMYRFTFDKSQIPAETAETMRLVVGYSEKGPFNNPVYIDNKQDFINLFGNINKRLEKKGVFFHRMALQALSAGPILALNLKPFGNNPTNVPSVPETDPETGEVITPEPQVDSSNEAVKYVSFNPCDVANATEIPTYLMDVRTLFETDRFWKLDSDKLGEKSETLATSLGDREHGYINIAATESKEQSCSIFIRKCHKRDTKQYEVSLRDWYMNLNEDVPEYLDNCLDTLVSDFFADVYVFRGQFTDSLMSGALKKYFDAATGSLKTDYINNFYEASDALTALASDPASNFIGLYRGCLLPYFKDMNGNYVSLDIVFNADKDTHKMIMKLDDNIIDDVLDIENGHNKLTHWPTQYGWSPADANVNTAMKPTHIEGYTYGTISRSDSAMEIYEKSLNVLSEKGIFEALTNHVDSEYHYIVDTYATQIYAENNTKTIGPKKNISIVAKAKDNCLAIMNFIPMEKLVKNQGFDLDEIRNYITLPSETDGASYCAFYTPLVFGEGSVKSIIPSAALVSNNFMEKWNSRQPYYIVAGPNYGRMEYPGLIGPDYNYARNDLDVFEPFGVNCMVYVPRKGTYINSNQTAKQTPVSALSKVHVRELVIYLQNEIENMMQNYQWELNTQTLRDTIKTNADTILERIKANGGVYDYINVCDGTNNTPEVIDNEMIILDTSIEPARGAGKMVQRLTIHRTGGISSLTK